MNLKISDEEILCLYLYGLLRKQHEIKTIYNHSHDHLSDFFPTLPSHTAFVQRLNQLSDVFIPLWEKVQARFPKTEGVWSIDSMPIIMAQGTRRYKAKVSRELANSGYCPTKKLYYHGVKLHCITGALPLPDFISITGAKTHDVEAFKPILPYLHNNEIYGDKAYQLSKDVAENQCQQGLTIRTPVKKAKGQAYLETSDQWLSTAVSKVRQPIESLFGWIQEKTGIQIAGRVRSSKGLFVHVFGRLLAAFLLLAELVSKLSKTKYF